MRFLILISLVLLTAACKGTGPSISDRAHYEGIIQERYSEEVRNRLLPEATRLAADRYRSEDSKWQFIYSFLNGYEHGTKEVPGTVIIGNGRGAHQRGFDAGLNHWRETRDLTLVDLGYEPVDAGGFYTSTNFEESSFQPNGSNERWWIEFRDGAWTSFVGKRDRYVERLPCRLRGYLHPRHGGRGHFNMYDREVIVYEVVNVKPN